MKRRFSYLILSSIVLIFGYFSYTQNTGKLYAEYEKLWQYRILHPEVLPDPALIRLTSWWNTTSYADSIWIWLIQYIGDNLMDNGYHSFLNPLIEKIVELHPHFTETYNIALLLSPNLNPEKKDYEERRKIAMKALEIWERWIQSNCNAWLLKRIFELDFSPELWENSELKNPCNDSMLAYNVAITANELGKYDIAKNYFKAASVQEESPQASRFLWPLMDAKRWDNRSAWERFLLISLSGYDEPPFTCQNWASKLIQSYKVDSFPIFISWIETIEKSLIAPKDTTNPVATSGNTCYSFITRAMKQFYLAYISEVAKDVPEVTTGSGLIEKGLLKKIPTIKEQTGWTVVKKNNQWTYTE